MIDQLDVWIISLIGMGIVALIFIGLITEAKKQPRPKNTVDPHHHARVVRRWLFGLLIVIFTVGSYASLHHYPIPPQHQKLDAKVTVNVTGHQWYWKMSTHQVPIGVPVEFDVTSADVNHDFAIYDPKGLIVAQVQAMPGFHNKMLYTFRQPGTYRVRCLEYCGLAHAQMEAEIKVVAATNGKDNT